MGLLYKNLLARTPQLFDERVRLGRAGKRVNGARRNVGNDRLFRCRLFIFLGVFAHSCPQALAREGVVVHLHECVCVRQCAHLLTPVGWAFECGCNTLSLSLALG